MKGLKKKALSALLTLVMAVGMLQPMAVEAAETVALPNAAVYQEFPTHYQDKDSNKNADGSLRHLPGQVVHPDVVYMEDGWNGYKYWAVYTPNVSVTSQYENPYIAASNDGATWVEPEGIKNPIEPEPINTHLHNCDADMIYNEEMDAMMAYWNWANDNNWGAAPLGAEVRVRISYDGIHWGVPSTYDEETGIWTKPADESERTLKPATTDKWGLDNSFITVVSSKDRYDMLSPTFVYDSYRDIYLMWANNTGNTGYTNGQRNFVEIRWSEDGLTWSEPMKVNNFLGKTTDGKSIAPWHQDVNYIPELKMFIALSQCFTGGSPDGSMLYMTVSKDGVNWQQVGTEAIMNPGKDGAWDDFQIYRSCLVYDNGLMKVWYSALQKNAAGKMVIDANGELTLKATSEDQRVWRIGYTENEYVDIMKIQTGDANYTIPEFVTGTALALSAEETELEVGNDTLVNTAFTPAETSDQVVKYTSSDEAVVTVSPLGVVEAIGAGTATVKGETADGIEGTIEFTVTEPDKATTDTYLSDLDWIEQSCGGGYITAKDTNCDGGDLKVLVDGAEKTFDKGLGVHAPSSVTYNIAGKGYMKFQAYAGVDHYTIKDYPGEAIIGNFIVKIDGEVVAESGEMNPSMDAYYFDVTIPADAKTLTLETEIGEAQDWSDWADWADAKLIVELGDPENLALNKTVTVKKTADDSDAAVNSDRPATMAVDGVNGDSQANYCDFGSDGADESVYLQVDLGKLCMVDTVNLYRYWLDGRTYDGTVIALSETSDFANPTIIYNSDADDVHGFGAGTDATYVETEEGMSFDADYAQGRFLRVYMAGSDRGTTNHVVEVEAWGYEIEGDAVPAESVKITATRVSYEEGTTIKEGRKAYLEASILPLESTDEIVSWTSADEKIATVEFDGDECTVTGVSAGDVEITATTTSGAKGTITINVLEKKEAAPLRRVVDAEHILYLENYYWSDDFANKNGVAGNVPQDERVDSPVMLWETVPDSLKDNTVILLIAERSLNNTADIKQWIKDNVELCNANNIPCAVQNVNGETRMANPIPIEFWEELVQENEYFVGFNGAELYNRFNGDAREYMVDLIQMGVENGIHMMWTDTNTFDCESGNGTNSGVLVDWLEYCPDLAQVMRDNKEYISLMYKESYGNPSTEALYVGMWLTDYIGNWGIASDWWHWQLDSNGALFGAGSGGDAWKQCLTWPEAMYTMDILRAASQGATCFKSEAQWYSNATKGMRTPGYQYSIAPFLEKLASGEYKIPSKAEVAAHTKAVVVGRNNWSDFIYDKNYSQLYPATDKYGIVPFVPVTCPEESLEGFELVIKENLGSAALKAKLDEVYAADVTGGSAYCANYGDTYYFMNSSEDKDVTQNAIITPQVTDGVDSVEITGTPHTYGVITEAANEITFSLGNYRIDKSEIWSSAAPGWFGDMECYQYVWEMCERMGDLADPTDDTNHDTVLRETVIKVTCDAEPTAVFAEDNEYTKPYEYTESYADGVYTLTLKHNGIVDVDLVMSEVKVTAIDLGAEDLAMTVGENAQLAATITPADATTNVEWTSSDESVATVVNGKVYAKAAGTATITAKADDAEATIEVKVNEIEVTGLELDADAVTILEGDAITVKATVTPGNATNKTVTWTSSDESVATVVNGTITGVKAGTATVTAKTANGLEVTVAVTVEVNPSHEIPQSSMTATSDSEYAGTGEGPASNVLDGDLGTIWHSNYAPKDELPVYIELNLNGTYDVHKVVYVPRNGGGNGTITSYELYITDAEGNETLLTTGTWAENADTKTVEFEPVEATKVKVKVLEGKGGFASAAEFKVFFWSEESVEPPVEPPVEESEVVRISGKDRYATGYKVADAYKAELGVDKFDAVVVATGKNFADALSGSYLAIVKEAPILLTNGKDDNVAELHAYIKENVNADGTVYILGGTAAVPATVEAIEGYTVKRLSGTTRYETNLDILAEAGITGTELIVATGKEFADSLSASATGRPILLVKPGAALSAEQKAVVETVKGGNIYVVGGEGAVTAETAAELEAYGAVERIAGAGRQETSKKIAEKFFADAEAVVAANAKNFPDGLCGGPLAAAMEAPLLLTATGNTAIAEGYVQGNGLTSGVVLGGTGALSDEAVVDVFGLESAEDIVLK